METKWVVVYADVVVEQDLPRLSKRASEQIRKSIENKLIVDPMLFGKPLRTSLAGYRSLRVGDYRIVFRIDKNKVKVLAILHRSKVYIVVEKRVGV